MADVWVLGSLNVDVVVRVARHPAPGETVLGDDPATTFGGKGANQAVAAAAAGASVRMLGAVGQDAEGGAYRDRLDAFGIDTTGVRQVDGVTGRALIVVAEDGENTIVVSPGANAAVGQEDLEALQPAPGDVVLLQLEVALDVVAEAARRADRAGARVVLNIAPFAALPPDVLDLADPVLANEGEAAELVARPRELLVTRGAEGSTWGDLALPAAPVAAVIDTTGAGDAYCGALAAALAAGADRAAAMRTATAAAATAVSRRGAQPDPD